MFVKTLEDGRRHVRLSHSAMDTWINCPLKGLLQYKYNFGQPRPQAGVSDLGPPLSALFGNAGHAALPYWSITGDVDAAQEKFLEVFNIPTEQEFGNFTAKRGLGMVAMYAQRYAGKDGLDRLDTVYINKKPQIEQRDIYTIVDRDDLLIEMEVILDNIVIDHEQRGIWVKDIKTTGSPITENGVWWKNMQNSDQWPPYILWAMGKYEDILGVPVLGVCLDAIYTRRKVFGGGDFERSYFEVGENLPISFIKQFPFKAERVARQIIKLWDGEEIPNRNTSYCSAYMRSCKFIDYCNPDLAAINISVMEGVFAPYYKEEK